MSTALFLALSLAVIRMSRRPIRVLAAVALILVSAIIISPFFAERAFHFDPNAGVRALFWRDSIRAELDTSGLGVGFGTEFIRNQFWRLGLFNWTIVSETSGARLFITTHSIIYDLLLRVGIPGLALFVMWAGHLASETPDGSTSALRRDAALKSLALIYSLFNPAVDSMMAFRVSLDWAGCQTKPFCLPKEGAFEWLS